MAKPITPTQDELQKFVNNEVIINQSSLVDKLLHDQVANYDYENIANLYHGDTYCPYYYEPVLPNEQGNCSLCDASFDNQQDIFEWWIVTPYLLEQLERLGQPILKTEYQSYWGRTTTGQAIALDSVIEQIYKHLNTTK